MPGHVCTVDHTKDSTGRSPKIFSQKLLTCVSHMIDKVYVVWDVYETIEVRSAIVYKVYGTKDHAESVATSLNRTHHEDQFRRFEVGEWDVCPEAACRIDPEAGP